MVHKKGFVHELIRNRILFLMILPVLIFFFVNSYIPMVGIYYAFVRFDFNSDMFHSRFVGLENFKFLWQSGALLKLTLNTIGYNAAFIVLGNVLAIACAILLSELKIRWFKKLMQSIMFRSLKVTFEVGFATAAGLYQSLFGFVLIVTVNAIIRKMGDENLETTDSALPVMRAVRAMSRRCSHPAGERRILSSCETSVERPKTVTDVAALFSENAKNPVSQRDGGPFRGTTLLVFPIMRESARRDNDQSMASGTICHHPPISAPDSAILPPPDGHNG